MSEIKNEVTVKKNRMSQIVAIEKSEKARTHSTITRLNKLNQKDDLFNGFTKTYSPLNDEGFVYPDENKKVQHKVNDVLEMFAESMKTAFDLSATKDYGNTQSFADVIVEGNVLIEKAPIPFLLYLEKELLSVKTFITNLPELSINEDWTPDVNTELFKTEPVKTHKTKREQRVIVRYEATDRHPAQTDLIPEDIIVGLWTTVKQSGAMPEPKKRELLKKVEKLSNAVKYAREEANSTLVENKQVGEAIFSYLLK